MNIFTRVFLSLSLIALVGVSNAQPYDLEVTDVVTVSTSSNQIPADIVANILMNVVNNGPDPIPANTPIWVAIQVNASYYLQPDTFSFNVAIPSGAGFSYTSQNTWTFSGNTPSVEICAGAYFADSALEANANNNFHCENFTVTTAANVDWAMVSTTIQEPSILDGFDIDNGTEEVPQFDSITFTMANESDLVFPRLYSVRFQMAFNGDTTTLNGSFGSNVNPGDERTFILNPSSFPDQVQDSGSYAFCIIADDPADDVDTNDIACDSFQIVDTYDPFDPANWPLGKDEVVTKQIQLIPTTDAIRVEGIQHHTDVTITDMQGRVVRVATLHEDGSIPLSDERSGVYIIKASDETSGQIEVKKFTKH